MGVSARQSKAMSAVESAVNILVGMGIAFAGQLIIFPALGIAVTLDQNIVIMLFFTVVSFFRSYFLRRLFAGLGLKNKAHN